MDFQWNMTYKMTSFIKTLLFLYPLTT